MGTRITYTQLNEKSISTTVGSWGNLINYSATYKGYVFLFPMEEGKTYYLNRGANLNNKTCEWHGFQYTTENAADIGRDNIIGTYEGGDFHTTGQNIPTSMVGKTGAKTGAFTVLVIGTDPAPTDFVVSEGEPMTYETTTYAVTNTLSHCTNSNANTSVNENASYSAVISPASGYEIDSVSCTMGGTAQTVTNNGNGTYSISIGAVTGNIAITATASAVSPDPTVYTITNTLTNCTNSNNATTAERGTAYTAQITAASGYELKSVTCTMGGVSQTVTGGAISIANVTGNIVIIARASQSGGGVEGNEALYESLSKVLPSYASAIKGKVTLPTGRSGQIMYLDGNGGVYAGDAPEGGGSGSGVTPEQAALIGQIPNKVDLTGTAQVTAKNNAICENQSKNLVIARLDGKTISTGAGTWGNIGTYSASYKGYVFVFPMEEGKEYFFNRGNTLGPKYPGGIGVAQYTAESIEEIGQSTIIGTYSGGDYITTFGGIPKQNNAATKYNSVTGKAGVKLGVLTFTVVASDPAPEDVVISEGRPIVYEPTEIYKVDPDYIKDFDGAFLKDKQVYWFGDSIMAGLYCNSPISSKMDALFGSVSNNMAVSMAKMYNNQIPGQVTSATEIQPDYVVFDGGANDCNSILGPETNKSCYNSHPGAMVEDAPNASYNYGTDTVCGAFETMCQRIRVKYPKAKVFYVSTHYIGANHPYAEQKGMYEEFQKICHKWAIPVVDITNEGNINSYLDDTFTAGSDHVTPDKTHPTDACHYKYYLPMIVRKMAESSIDYNE